MSAPAAASPQPAADGLLIQPLPPDNRSQLKRWIDSLGRDKFRRYWYGLEPEQQRRIAYDWSFVARPNQLAPAGNWRTWLVMAGRGFGKSRTGAEFIRGEIEAGRMGRVALIAPTAGDARDVMVEGESGILAVSPPWFRPKYEPSKRRITWPNGAIATVYSAEEPDRLRGPQHDGFWADEAAAWWEATKAWDMLRFGLRLGRSPRGIVTTTPRPVPLLVGDEGENRAGLLKEDTTHITTGSTYDNADNLAGAFLDDIRKRYENTRLGRQEIFAELLMDTPGALWTRAVIKYKAAPEELSRIVVAIDPAASATEGSDETGIGAAGLGFDGQAYVLADRSCRLLPLGWADRAVRLYDEMDADRIIIEDNQGGDMVESTLRTVAPRLPIRRIHAKQGKRLRAEPVSALYEQGGKVWHSHVLRELEDQMCNFTGKGGERDDRVDWLVHALTELVLKPGPVSYQPPARPIAPRRM